MSSATSERKFQWNFNENTKKFIEENPFENVICKMVSTLLSPQGEPLY